MLLLKQQILFTMLLILEILYIKLLICIFLLETMLLFFSNEFSVIYMYSLKNLNNFELMDKQEAIILLPTVYLTLSLSRELELLEKNYSILLHTKNR